MSEIPPDASDPAAPASPLAVERRAPIFIVGCERSGTTLLRLMLASHPRIALPPQTKYVRYLYKRRVRIGDLRKRGNRDRLAAWFSRNLGRRFMIGDLELDEHRLLDGMRQASTLGDAMALPWQMYAAGWGKPRWGDKRPYYIRYLRGLYSMFPDARVIHIIRDPRDVIASLRRVPWWERGLTRSIANWNDCIRRGRAALRDYPGQFFQLRYEDLVADPEAMLRPICEFIGEEFAREMLDQSTIADRAVPTYKRDWHQNTFRAVNSSAIGRWKSDLPQADADLITWATRDYLEALGYLDVDRALPGRADRAIYRMVERAHRARRLGFEIFDRISERLYFGPLAYTADPGAVSGAKEGGTDEYVQAS